jgi:hypothetical protein
MNPTLHIYCRPWYNQRGALLGTDALGRYLVRLFRTGEMVTIHPVDCELVK